MKTPGKMSPRQPFATATAWSDKIIFPVLPIPGSQVSKQRGHVNFMILVSVVEKQAFFLVAGR